MYESPEFIGLLVDLYNDEKKSDFPKSYFQPLKKLLDFYGVNIDS